MKGIWGTFDIKSIYFRPVIPNNLIKDVVQRE